jgi:hypothetical protein
MSHTVKQLDPTVPGRMLVYLITCKPTGQKYVGIVYGKKQTVASRWKEHCKAPRHGRLLFNATQEHGSEQFTVETIDAADDIPQLGFKECFHIRFHGSHFSEGGLNGSCGGGDIASAHSPEVRARASAAMRKAFENPELRAHQSAAMHKHYENPAARARASAAHVKYFENPEAHARHSAAMRKHYENPEARTALRKARGTPEARAHNSAARRKQWANPEAHARHSAAMRKALENPESRARQSAAAQNRCIKRWPVILHAVRLYAAGFTDAQLATIRQSGVTVL